MVTTRQFKESEKYPILLNLPFTEKKFTSRSKNKYKRKRLVTKKSPERSLPLKQLKWSTKEQHKSVL